MTSCIFIVFRAEGVYRGVSRAYESLPLSDVNPAEIRHRPTGRRTATSATGRIGGGQPRAPCEPYIQTQVKENRRPSNNFMQHYNLILFTKGKIILVFQRSLIPYLLFSELYFCNGNERRRDLVRI